MCTTAKGGDGGLNLGLWRVLRACESCKEKGSGHARTPTHCAGVRWARTLPHPPEKEEKERANKRNFLARFRTAVAWGAFRDVNGYLTKRNPAAKKLQQALLARPTKFPVLHALTDTGNCRMNC